MDYERLYEYRFKDVDQSQREVVWSEIAMFVHAKLGFPGRVLDPAAGRGEFILSAPARERWAVDRVVHEAGLAASEVRFIAADVMAADLPSAHFDGIFVSNFLEHIATQEACASFLERMRDVTARHGRIAIMGPNYRYCQGEYWDCADHTLALTHVAVEEHLYAAGFTPLETSPRFLPYSFRSALPASRRLTAAYLRTPLIWRALGKQYLVVAERL